MKTILIVAAVTEHRELLVAWLKDDYAVRTAPDGAAGMALATRVEPDLLFIALALPDIDSAEAIRHLKSQTRLRDVPIIALTARSRPEEDIQARAAGCVDTLRTPLEAEAISTLLRKWLGGG